MVSEYYVMRERLSKEKRIIPKHSVTFQGGAWMSFEELDAACKSVISALQSEIREELHTVECMAYVLKETKEALNRLPIRL